MKLITNAKFAAVSIFKIILVLNIAQAAHSSTDGDFNLTNEKSCKAFNSLSERAKKDESMRAIINKTTSFMAVGGVVGISASQKKFFQDIITITKAKQKNSRIIKSRTDSTI